MLISFLKAAFTCYLKSEFLISRILMQMLYTMRINTQINFSLRDREVFIFAFCKILLHSKSFFGFVLFAGKYLFPGLQFPISRDQKNDDLPWQVPILFQISLLYGQNPGLSMHFVYKSIL